MICTRIIRLVIMTSLFGLPGTVIAQLCPPCAKDIAPLPGIHGAAPDGRRNVNVYLDTSPPSGGWGNPPPQTLSDGLNQAINKWNDATDQYGNKTCYYLNRVSNISLLSKLAD
jgi:hypothetical protein